ncbi:MAG: DUF3299 domain-containing protein [Enhydrobacter sp.]|nr:DUF3299 domain-containing protein [Enhydrobacter sp.]
MRASLIASVLAASLLSAALPAGAVQPTGQPPEERLQQQALPQADDPLWAKFVKCKLSYDEETGVYSIQMTREVKALHGKTITMRGFVLPMDGSDRTQHFLLTRNTPVCMYCPPGGPNEVVEVRSSRPIAWTDKIVSITGKLNLVNDQERAIFFKVENAEVK